VTGFLGGEILGYRRNNRKKVEKMEKSTNINERNYQKLTSLKALSLEVALLRIEKQKKFLLQNKKRIIG